MKEIVYGTKRKVEVVDESEYNGVKYVILNLGTHPTAYVENILGVESINDAAIDDVVVHGGFTWLGPSVWGGENSCEYLGWDYAHLSDYIGSIEKLKAFEGKKWTYAEILNEVHHVIDQLLKIKERLEYHEERIHQD